MDKKLLLRKSLAKIMVDQIDQIDRLVALHPDPVSTQKADGTPVTALDLALSELIEAMVEREFGEEVTFYSEEKHKEWAFPLMALDPLDGTKEYLAQRPEWAMSLGLLLTENFEGQGWVYNPKTRECYSQGREVPVEQKPTYNGEVSRSEWDQGLFKGKSTEIFSISPMGSIAYKLGRLSGGATDFVVSLRPKNIWDIAGGTLLCQESGIKFYSQGQEVKKVQKTYAPPLIWCREGLSSELISLFP